MAIHPDFYTNHPLRSKIEDASQVPIICPIFNNKIPDQILMNLFIPKLAILVQTQAMPWMLDAPCFPYRRALLVETMLICVQDLLNFYRRL